ncbi:hypothetical protein VTN96DRAFT_4091 [Rasamsonia emersonii]
MPDLRWSHVGPAACPQPLPNANAAATTLIHPLATFWSSGPRGIPSIRLSHTLPNNLCALASGRRKSRNGQPWLDDDNDLVMSLDAKAHYRLGTLQLRAGPGPGEVGTAASGRGERIWVHESDALTVIAPS